MAKEGIRYQMKGMVADPEECDMEELLQLKNIEKSLAVFCLATYGEGDPTDNAMEFYDWIKDGDVDMAGLNYAVSMALRKYFCMLTLLKVTKNMNLEVSTRQN